MKIKIDLKIFIFLLIFIFTRQIKIYLLLMIFALIHEIGHLIAGILIKLKPDTIQLTPYGFSISFKANCKDYNTKIKNANKLSIKRLIIALAGPFTNLINIVFFIMLSTFTGKTSILNTSINTIVYANILIMVFNLLPVYPMDGGRAIKEIIHITIGLKESYKYINAIANISLVILTAISSIYILFYKNIAIVLILAYLWLINIKRNKYFESKEKILDTIYCKNFE